MLPTGTYLFVPPCLFFHHCMSGTSSITHCQTYQAGKPERAARKILKTIPLVSISVGLRRKVWSEGGREPGSATTVDSNIDC